MGRKPQENPQLDMTPMIDVVFELIIFFVVTLVEAQKKDETIELEDGQHGIVLVPEELPPSHMEIDGGRAGHERMHRGRRLEDLVRRSPGGQDACAQAARKAEEVAEASKWRENHRKIRSST